VGALADQVVHPVPALGRLGEQVLVIESLEAAAGGRQAGAVQRGGGEGVIDTAIGLSVAALPQGITAAFSPHSLPPSASAQEFRLTLTAAPDVTPAEATLQVTATDDAEVSAHAQPCELQRGRLCHHPGRPSAGPHPAVGHPARQNP
jgi:hypothetical protein